MWVPEVHYNATLKSIPDTCNHKKFIAEYVAHIHGNVKLGAGLLLFGRYSQGKSACAAICLKVAALYRHIGFWVNAQAIPGYIIEHVPFNSEISVWERMQTVPLLVIDEMQIRKNDVRYSEQAIDQIVRIRNDAMRSTIITTNHEPAFLQQEFPALAAVLTAAVVPIKVDGHDFRKPKGQEALKRLGG